MNPGGSSRFKRPGAIFIVFRTCTAVRPCMLLSLALYFFLHVMPTFSQALGVDVAGNVTDPQGLP